ncbi:MAG TPA: PQQ-dependent sugar dehydrogenase [Bryobacteraceae bacterium]|nr:PQQ-dependent sugar dehydrogenase [Bryobacteraceae bacterium]
MKLSRWIAVTAGIGIAAALLAYASKTDGMNVITGQKAFTNTASLRPGLARKITAQDLPQPNAPGIFSRLSMYATVGLGRNGARPENAIPKAPAGFKVDLFVWSGLMIPRQIRRAPNGDIFMADTGAGTVRIYRGITAEGKPRESSVYASLPAAFGMDFYPPGPNPQWVYVSNTTMVVRYAYKNGDLKASGEPEKLISNIPGGGHSTRDLVFSKDGKRLFLAVGSASNNNDNQAEFRRANILEYTPEGTFLGIYAAGIRNPVGLAVNPDTGELWASVNERDNLGDNLVPDYVTHVERGGFYGWPWFYIGGNQDPAHAGKHPELKNKVILPDVLIQAHSASLGMTFYDGEMFPAEYQGDAFAAEHGSWNHSQGSGREVIRIPIEKGRASGVYQDFLTGFTTNGTSWGRPVGVAVASDGSLLVTDDGAKVIWRVSYQSN